MTVLAATTAEVESRYAWWRLAASLALMTIGGSGMYAVTVVPVDLERHTLLAVEMPQGEALTIDGSRGFA